MDRVLSDGGSVHSLVALANDFFGAPTAIIYVHAFLGVCFCFYQSTGLLAVLNGEFGLVERDCPMSNRVPTFLTPNVITPRAHLLLPAFTAFSFVLLATVVYTFAVEGQSLAALYRLVGWRQSVVG